MLKALFKKQMMETGALFFRDRKTGKTRKGAGAAGFAVLYGLAFLSVAFLFFTMAHSIASQLVSMGFGRLYFALMSLMALAFGVFGSVFNTYAGLYQAKDNELLLSMPIPPAKILLARLSSVALLGLLYESLVWIPSMIAYAIAAGTSPLLLLCQLLTGLFLAMIVTALTCFLGWVIALAAGRLKNKSFVTVLIALAFIAAYYVLYGNAYRILASLLEHADAVGEGVKSYAYPFWQAGGASLGDPLSLLIFALICSAALALTWIVLERSFLKIATTNRGAAKKVYREKRVRAGSIRSALFRKEMKRFTSSATYMLNCGLGSVFAVVGAAALLIKAGAIRGELALISEVGGENAIAPYLPHITALVLCLIAALNDITAPSVSMEGKSLWIVRTCPVDPWDALAAKLWVHISVTLTPIFLAWCAAAVVLRLSLPGALLALFAAAAFTVFGAAEGLALNLLSPNLNWTNETVPLKNSMPVFVMIFGSWGILAVLCFGTMFLAQILPPLAALAVSAALLALAAALLLLWLKKKGTKRFEGLE